MMTSSSSRATQVQVYTNHLIHKSSKHFHAAYSWEVFDVRRMIGKLLKLFNTVIVGLILFNNFCSLPATGEPETTHGTSITFKRECPTDNNSVCIKGYLHLVECFKSISENQENFSFAFFPNNKASSLYVTVTYKINYTQNGSGSVSDDTLVDSSYYIEEWVWSHTLVYIMFHPKIFKFLSIGYGEIDDRINSVELTIPRLCPDNNDNHKLIERLTQMVHLLYTVS